VIGLSLFLKITNNRHEWFRIIIIPSSSRIFLFAKTHF